MTILQFIEGMAVVAQVPLLAALVRRPSRRDAPFWFAVIVACLAAALVAGVEGAGGWQTGFVATLWTTLAGTLAVYLLVAAVNRDAWRLAPLVGAYATAVAGFSFLIGLRSSVPEPAPPGLPETWFIIHVSTAVITYALVTLAAIAALAASVQDKAVKGKQPTRLSRLLPSIAGCEALSLRLLVIGVVVLATGLMTGMAIEYLTRGDVLPLNHKTVLTIAAFVVLTALLAAHYWTGMRGRKAVRMVLLGYLLLALGYPGVKFVTDVLLARHIVGG